MEYGKQGANGWNINRRDWSEVAIALTRRELASRGLQITDSAAKKLTLSVEAAHLEIGFVASTATVALKVETDDGYEADFVGLNKSGRPVGVIYLGDGALMRAVAEMLKDPKIVELLTH